MSGMTRREAMRAAGAAALGTTILPALQEDARPQEDKKVIKSGRLKQGVCRKCFKALSLEELCTMLSEMGLKSIDFLRPDDWEKVRERGLVCSMGSGFGGGSISDGFNDKANHDRILKGLETAVPLAARHGVPNLIAFVGDRKGRGDGEALDNCVEGLNRIKPLAEEHQVTICLELLNSKLDHKDYQGDRTPFCADIVKAVGSPHVKLLYDIYHMQIMEGDIIRTIRKYKDCIAHYHTAGVPGRNEPDETQELNYRAICKAIVDTGFEGYLCHEYVAKRDPVQSLRRVAAICDA